VNPPLFEYDENTDHYVATHHTFTQPIDEHIALLETNPTKMNYYHYNLVLNNFKIGNNSVHLHNPEIQQHIFTTLDINEEESHEKSGGFTI